MTGKERAKFRAEANSLEPVFHMGKGGLTQAVINQTEEVLKTRELIKIKVLLETTPESPKEIAPKIAEAVQAEIIQVIGGCMIFYKYNPELHEEAKRKAEAIAKAKKTAQKLKNSKTAERNGKKIYSKKR